MGSHFEGSKSLRAATETQVCNLRCCLPCARDAMQKVQAPVWATLIPRPKNLRRNPETQTPSPLYYLGVFDPFGLLANRRLKAFIPARAEVKSSGSIRPSAIILGSK